MGSGTSFHRVIGESGGVAPDEAVRRVVLCSGKVYFDLVKERARRREDRVALVRIEQLYPFPSASLAGVLRRYRNADIVWCQEEPQNMGAWNFVDRRVEQVLARLDIAAKRPRVAGRAEAASPATGLHKRHVEEQSQLVGDALAA
jgi:2-oxoglutarate dehydrogenase E1 component